jgi:hypothetical protein
MDTILGDPASERVEAEAADLREHFPGAHFESMGGAGDVGSGYDLTVGHLLAFYPRRFLKADKPALVLAQEFGTQSNTMVARAMILENQAFNHKKEEQPRWSELSRDAFYVRTREWKDNVRERGLKVLEQAIARSSIK